MRCVVLLLLLMASFGASADTAVKPGQIFPGAGTLSLTLSAGGVAQTLMAAQPASSPIACMFRNPDTTADQGVTAEIAYINTVGTAVASQAGASITLNPGDAIVTGPQTRAISWIAATTGHKLQAWCWQ